MYLFYLSCICQLFHFSTPLYNFSFVNVSTIKYCLSNMKHWRIFLTCFLYGSFNSISSMYSRAVIYFFLAIYSSTSLANVLLIAFTTCKLFYVFILFASRSIVLDLVVKQCRCTNRCHLVFFVFINIFYIFLTIVGIPHANT